jgi:hypothetical protein
MLCDRLTGDQRMGGHSMVYHYLDELKTDDRYSIHRDLMQLRLLIHHVIRQNVPMMVDLNLDGQLFNCECNSIPKFSCQLTLS